MSDFIEWGALGQVVVAGLIVGAGIPALFALGLRLLAGTTPVPQVVTVPVASADGQDGAMRDEPARLRDAPVQIARPSAPRLVGAIACMAVVVATIGAGLVFIVTGGH